ncbi:MAG TPA: hypothetical protein VEY07_05535 [Thermoplasmata archaeon]|nr:hypothetical protein [Thermoplasmata archaeon]
MSANMPFPSSAPSGRMDGTLSGVQNIRRALRQLRSLATVALAAVTLVFILDGLNSAGLLRWPPLDSFQSFTDWWRFGLQVGTLVTFGIAIAVLCIAGIIYALSGVFAWRRGVVEVRAAAPIENPSHVHAAIEAREDHSLTLWAVLLSAVAGIGVGVVASSVNISLDISGRAALPAAAVSIATSLAGAIGLVFAYHFGSRSLVRTLFELSSPLGQERLTRGRNLLLVGALVGLSAAFAPLSWAFTAGAIVSLGFVVLGSNELLGAYDDWLTGGKPAPSLQVGTAGVPA